MAKEIRDWFNRDDPNHVAAYFRFRRTGEWPAGFIGTDVWFQDGWEEELLRRTSEHRPPQAVTLMVEEYSRVLEIVEKLAFQGYEFILDTLGLDRLSLRVRYWEPDVMTGVIEDQLSREWVFPHGQTVGQLVQTAFKAILTSLEHRAREHFLFRGKPVLQPHLDVEQVWAMLPDRETHSSETVLWTVDKTE